MVTKDPDNLLVKKALIELIADDQSQAGNYTAVTGADGTFRIENIVPGRYHLFAERSGLLDTATQKGHSDGRILNLTVGQEITDLHFRLQAAAVIHGRVTDEDGDPLPNTEVTVLRQTYVAGRKHWEQAGAERTNDLGEYRIANLAAGSVYISVNPPPDFKSLIENAGSAPEAHNAKADAPPSPTYQTTYYPGTPDRSQALPIQLHARDEIPANFTLTPGPSLSIRGSVVNVPRSSSATIMLQSRDFSLILNGAEMHKDGSFVIHDVSPGSYTIVASIEGSGVQMTARQPLKVVSTNIEGLRLAPRPGTTIRGRMRIEARNGATRFVPERLSLGLQSLEGEQDVVAFAGRGTYSNLAHVAQDGSFVWTDVPAGTYFVRAMGDSATNEGWFLKSVASGGSDLADSGLTVSGGTVVMDLIISANGATVDGVVVDHKGDRLANAIVVAVLESRLRSRTDRYRKTAADQSGRFTLRGIPPGDYTLLAWESVDGEVYYNEDFVKACEGQGTALRLEEGARKSLEIEALPAEDGDGPK